MFVLNRLGFEHVQGGLETYLFNSHGRHARHASDALRRIGAATAADALDAARVYVEQHAAAWRARHSELDELQPGSVVYPFLDLDTITAWADGPVISAITAASRDVRPTPRT